MNPYYDRDGITIYHGDCLDVLADLEIPVDAVVTDPPYASGSRTEAGKSSSGAMLRAGRFADRPIDLDQMTTTGFVWLLRAVAYRCYDMLPEGGSFMSFIDWRQWPNLVGALETCNLRVQGMVVWDKGSIGLGNGFRTQHELVCHASKGVRVWDGEETALPLGSYSMAPVIRASRAVEPEPAYRIAEPYTARRCDICDTWIYCADGPFAEGDPTKTIADYDHWAAHHATPAELAGPVIGFPYMPWNDGPVKIAV
jgi:hypothetical protein